jgi:hypothetical protein
MRGVLCGAADDVERECVQFSSRDTFINSGLILEEKLGRVKQQRFAYEVRCKKSHKTC